MDTPANRCSTSVGNTWQLQKCAEMFFYRKRRRISRAIDFCSPPVKRNSTTADLVFPRSFFSLYFFDLLWGNGQLLMPRASAFVPCRCSTSPSIEEPTRRQLAHIRVHPLSILGVDSSWCLPRPFCSSGPNKFSSGSLLSNR